MKQFAMFFRFLFTTDDSIYRQQKRRRKKEVNGKFVKREIIWSKSQAGPSNYWKTNILEKN